MNRGDRQPPKTVMVPLDGSEHALVALPVARALARALGDVLHVIHVGPHILPSEDLLRRLGLREDEIAGTVLHQAAGDPAREILRIASEHNSQAIVMCSATGLPAPLGVMGPTAEGVVREAGCPVVLVRPQRGIGPYSLGRILLPHDGTPTSAAAIGPGADLALRADAELLVLHVAAPGTRQPVEPGTLTVPQYVDQPQHDWPAWAREFLDRLACLGCLPKGLKLRLELGMGRPEEEILQRAVSDGTDLILLAWRGKLDRTRAPIVRAVIRDAPCPVMILRTAPEASG